MSISDLLKFGGKRSDQTGRGCLPTRRRPRRPTPMVPSKALPKFVGALAARRGADAGRLRPGDRPQRRVLRRAARAASCSSRISPPTSIGIRAPAHARRCPRRCPSGSRRRTAPSTACCAGTSSTSSTRLPRKALAREVVRVLRPGGAVFGFFCNTASERAPFTKFEIIEGVDAPAPATYRRRRREVRPAEPRHHPDVRRPDRLGLVPAQEQHARNPAAEAGMMCAPSLRC